ncbi:MFS transporter [Chitinophaga sedimenti]|uniref:MFS transporter n=1 Tax=Chitinophaga sedimenti TaxID=2033606 RepID=UPI0027E177F9|nr:MFS transporter [Chitinophaga sedimenti]
MAQSIFQLGGNAGSAIGPLLAALLVAPYGQTSIAWFSVVALLGIVVLSRVSQWYGAHIAEKAARKAPEVVSPFSRNRTIWALVILVVLIFSKYFYMACMSSYYTFFLINKFQLTTQQSQMYLFIFLGAVAAGTFIGGRLATGSDVNTLSGFLSSGWRRLRSLCPTFLYSGRPYCPPSSAW